MDVVQVFVLAKWEGNSPEWELQQPMSEAC